MNGSNIAGEWFFDMLRDIRMASRSMRRSPTALVVPVLSSALGISACSLIVGIANFALFRPLPVMDNDRLMSITGRNVRTGDSGSTISYPDYRDLATARSFDGVTAYFPMVPAAISHSGAEARRHWGAIATANYFDVVRPGFLFGRGFDSERDNTPGAPPVVVLSHQLWVSRFGGDPGITGRTIILNGRAVNVIGVTKPGFRGTDVAMVSDFWIPMSMRDVVVPLLPAHQLDILADRNAHWLFVLGRLRGDIAPESAATEAGVIAKRLANSFPATNKDVDFHVERAGQLSPAVRRAMVVFFSLLLAVAGLVLLTACANVANLLLARATARRKEMATRRAVGAGSGRIIRQLLTESILLSLLGGVLGYLIADAGARSLGTMHLPIALPVDFSVSLDYRVLLFCTALSVLTGVLFGSVPALHAIRQDVVSGLKAQPSQAGPGGSWNLRNVLVVSQVATSTLLLICAGLFLRSLNASRSADTGMANRNIALIGFDPSIDTDAAGRERLLAAALQRVQQIPGVQSAALTTTVPLSLAGMSGQVSPDDRPLDDKNAAQSVDVYEVSAGFFDTLGIAVLSGEDFRPGAVKDEVAILNRTAAEKLFPGQNAIGRRVRRDDRRMVRVIGVVATSKSRTIIEDPRPAMYLPLLGGTGAQSIMGVTLMLRTHGDPASYMSRAGAALRDVRSGLALFDVRTMEEHLNNALLLQRAGAFLFGLAGCFGLLIAGVGLYGVISFLVARQTKDIGIRMALGAQRIQIVGGVLGRGLKLTTTGAVLGLTLAILVSRGIATLLYGVSPTDALTVVSVCAFLFVTALLACAIPAVRAANVPPILSIRCE